jgi:hypothetical protein
MDAQELWATKFAKRHAEERAREEARREQAFLDVPSICCGEPLRMMTPRDLLWLNGAESPFVCPTEMDAGHVAMFYWVMHEENDFSDSWRNNRRKRAMLKRIAPRSFDELVAAGREYVDEVFQDAPQSGAAREERRPLGTCFLAPLVVNIALETGWTQGEIINTPLPRLFQYMKAIRAREQGKEFTDFSPSDALTDQFLCELNGSKN